MPVPPETTEYLCHSLKLMGGLFAPHDTLDRLLEEVARVALELLGVDHALVIWATDSPQRLWVRARWSRPGVVESPALSDQAVAFAENNQHTHTAELISPAGSRRPSENSMVLQPLKVKGESVGYLVLLPSLVNSSKFPTLLFSVIAEQIGRTIEIHQTRQFLASRYSALALLKESGEDAAVAEPLDGHLLAAVRNPDRVARILAKSFYRDLRKAGFDANQVLLVASEIIGNLTETIRKTRAKADKEGIPE